MYTGVNMKTPLRASESLRMVGLRVTGSEIGRVAPSARRGENLMAQSCPENHPVPLARHSFDKLVLSQSNVRRIKAGVSIEELAKTSRAVGCCKV